MNECECGNCKNCLQRIRDVFHTTIIGVVAEFTDILEVFFREYKMISEDKKATEARLRILSRLNLVSKFLLPEIEKLSNLK